MNDCRRLLLAAAMVTHQEAAVPVDPDGCTAALAVSHDRIIGEAGATDSQGASASSFIVDMVCIEREQSWEAQNLISASWSCSSLLESVISFIFLKICFTCLKM